VLVGLAESLGSFDAALDEAGRLLRTVGRVLPATTEPVVLKAEVAAPRLGADALGPIAGKSVEGQAAVANSHGIRRVELVPADATAPAGVVEAIAAADQVVIAPGSLYTSVTPVLCVADVQAALERTRARVVQVANLRPQAPETTGLDGTDHLEVALEHGARVDVFLYETTAALKVDEDRVRSHGVEPVGAALARSDGMVHDPRQLAKALRDLL
jgi:uncharacterized cofD-like protein